MIKETKLLGMCQYLFDLLCVCLCVVKLKRNMITKR